MNVIIQIDGRDLTVPPDWNLRRAALRNGIYVPGLCGHPDLPHANQVKWAAQVHRGNETIAGDFSNRLTPNSPPYQGGAGGDLTTAGEDACCSLCWVEAGGQVVRACETPATDGMVVRTTGEDLQRRRHEALAKILAHHPHACLTCAQRQGCSLTQCSSNVPVEERCCILLNRCEIGKVVDYLGLPENTPRYTFEKFYRTSDDPFFDRDYNLCIGCTRCVRICRDVRGVEALAATFKDNRVWVGTANPGLLADSFCRFCGACVEVCPTGALQDKPGSQPVRSGEEAPCMAACPAGIDIPGYLHKISEGDFSGALEIIYDRVPLPGVLGYVCFHPCEAACKRDSLGGSLAICSLKRFVYDNVPDKSLRPITKKESTGRKVAIVGSGPAGLTAGFYLAREGHAVEVFEASSQPGGMLRHAIPEYRLPLSVLDDELALFHDMGIVFHTGARLGTNFSLNDLLDSHDAVLLAVGTSGSRHLNVPGESIFGVTQALDLLRECKLREKGAAPRLEGRVVVIGGGNVAIDAAMSARRLGASDVVMVCLESADQMPAHSWEIAQAVEEGITVKNGWGPLEFIDGDGKLTSIRFKRCTRVFDDKGRFNPAYDETETMELPADHAIIAIGQKVQPFKMDDGDGLAVLPGGLISADPQTFQIGRDKIFAAGDAVSGPSSVIQAIAEGRKVADSIDKFLGGEGVENKRPSGKPDPYLGRDEEFHKRTAVRPSLAAPEERVHSFAVLECALTQDHARQEASRCLRCNLRAFITPVPLPPDKWQPLNLENIAGIPAVEGVFQVAVADRKPVKIAGVQDVRAALETECQSRQGDWLFCWEADHMYSKRESELIQQHLQAFGEMPGGGAGGDLDDLF
jgi:NADPH-dependent glutamate synthase beta subunit-like oxidoreductase